MKKAYLVALGAILLVPVVLVFAFEPGGVQAATTANCVINHGAGQTTTITFTSGSENAAAIADVTAAKTACETAAVGSSQFRDLAKDLGNYTIQVVRSSSIQFGEEGSRTETPIKIDVFDVTRAIGTPARMFGGTHANRKLIAQNLLAEVLAHEISAKIHPGHPHSTIVAAENTVLAQLQKDYQRILTRACGASVAWRFGPAKTVVLNVAAANSGGSFADSCVGGIAELPEVAGTPLETADSSILGTGILAIVIASAAAGAVALGGAAWYAWYARRRFTRS